MARTPTKFVGQVALAGILLLAGSIALLSALKDVSGRLNAVIALVAFGLTILAACLLALVRRHTFEMAAAAARSARASQRQDNRFRRIVESSPNAVVMVDERGRIEMVNAQAEKVFGYARAELLGQPVQLLMPARFRANHPHLLSEFWLSPNTRPMGSGRELYGLRKDGREFRLEIGLNPVEMDEGPMVLSTIVDISQRVELEAQLRQAQKMEAVGRLTAGIAHDFNNLLQVVMGSLELLRDRVGEDQPSDHLVRQSIDAAERGSRLTHSLLAFSRAQMLRPRRIEIAPLLRQTVEMLQRTLGPSIVIDDADQQSALHAFADSAQLEACILNLAINARDAMPDGGSLAIRTYGERVGQTLATETLPPGDYTVIAVEDSGCGIDHAIIDKVFEPFFTTKGPGKGSGLGLSMVLGYARQSGGDVRVATNLGIGTRIEIFLPQIGVAESEAIAAPAAKSAARAAGRILLVDDVSDVLVTLGAFLESSGYDVTRVGSADDALHIVAGPLALDGVVTDFAMPGMSGADLLLQIAQMRPGLPSLIVTGFPTFEALGRLPEHTQVLRKPFRRAELMTHVKVMLEQSRNGASKVATDRAEG